MLLDWTFAAQNSGIESSFGFIIVWLHLYFLPSIIALIKRNNRTKVILFNTFLCWTFVMWVISLVWACKREKIEKPKPKVIITTNSPADEIKRYKELLDDGIITNEEFEEKKKQLLGL